MSAILPSHHCGYQFRAEELRNFLDLVEQDLPVSSQSYQTLDLGRKAAARSIGMAGAVQLLPTCGRG